MTPAGEKLDRMLQAAIKEFGKQQQSSRMSTKMPNLEGVSVAIDKLTSAIEDDAKAALEKVETMHGKRKRVFGKANERIAARDAALDAADAALDKLDAALGDNGGPTSDGS